MRNKIHVFMESFSYEKQNGEPETYQGQSSQIRRIDG